MRVTRETIVQTIDFIAGRCGQHTLPPTGDSLPHPRGVGMQALTKVGVCRRLGAGLERRVNMQPASPFAITLHLHRGKYNTSSLLVGPPKVCGARISAGVFIPFNVGLRQDAGIEIGGLNPIETKLFEAWATLNSLDASFDRDNCRTACGNHVELSLNRPS